MAGNARVGNIAADLRRLGVEVATLTPLPGNPRKGDVDAVMRSYEQFGQMKPIVARRADRTVIAGNHQLQAATNLGWSHIAVVWTDADDATTKAFALADNRTADLGTYDDDLLAALLAEVQAAGDDALLAATGYLGDDLEKLLRRVEFTAGEGDPDDAPPLPDVAISRPGDLWILGPHRVLCGDATLADDHARLLDTNKADMIWTDPPYGVAYVGKTDDALTIYNDKLAADELATFLTASFSAAWKNTRPGATWFVASPPGPLHAVFARILADAAVLRGTIIWVKDQWTAGAAHQPTPDRTQDSVWEIDRPQRSTDHPTMKPVELVARAIENHTDSGDLVLDPFGGSGTTLIAANDLGRRACLLDLDPRYVDVICRRYQEHTGDKPVLARTGKARDFTKTV